MMGEPFSCFSVLLLTPRLTPFYVYLRTVVFVTLAVRTDWQDAMFGS